MFDGSSIAGWKGINESDMVLMPDPDAAFLDPFYDDTTIAIRCDVLEPHTMQGYVRDPRSLAKRAEEYLKSTGIADTAYFGPEPEFLSLTRPGGETISTALSMKWIQKKVHGTVTGQQMMPILATVRV